MAQQNPQLQTIDKDFITLKLPVDKKLIKLLYKIKASKKFINFQRLGMQKVRTINYLKK